MFLFLVVSHESSASMYFQILRNMFLNFLMPTSFSRGIHTARFEGLFEGHCLVLWCYNVTPSKENGILVIQHCRTNKGCTTERFRKSHAAIVKYGCVFQRNLPTLFCHFPRKATSSIYSPISFEDEFCNYEESFICIYIYIFKVAGEWSGEKERKWQEGQTCN